MLIKINIKTWIIWINVNYFFGCNDLYSKDEYLS